ncbi:MAG: HEAT repeat domain-containing protein [Candidatus Thorarchaeota archaeon]
MSEKEAAIDELRKGDVVGFRIAVEDLLRNQGWGGVHETLSLIQRESGLFRQAVAELLDLKPLTGIEVFPIRCVFGFKGQTLEELREYSYPIITKSIEEQIASGNTFFLDVDRLLTSPYAYLIPDIVMKRKEEIENLQDGFSIDDVIRTYYGFNLLFHVRLINKEPEVPSGISGSSFENMISKVHEICMKPPPREHEGEIFPNCAVDTNLLLLKLMSLSFSFEPWIQHHAISGLREQGDPRSIGYLNEVLRSPDNHIVTAVVSAMASCGEPVSRLVTIPEMRNSSNITKIFSRMDSYEKKIGENVIESVLNRGNFGSLIELQLVEKTSILDEFQPSDIKEVIERRASEMGFNPDILSLISSEEGNRDRVISKVNDLIFEKNVGVTYARVNAQFGRGVLPERKYSPLNAEHIVWSPTLMSIPELRTNILAILQEAQPPDRLLAFVLVQPRFEAARIETVLAHILSSASPFEEERKIIANCGLGTVSTSSSFPFLDLAQFRSVSGHPLGLIGVITQYAKTANVSDSCVDQLQRLFDTIVSFLQHPDTLDILEWLKFEMSWFRSSIGYRHRPFRKSPEPPDYFI